MDNKNTLQATPSPHDQLSDMIWGFTKAQLIYVAAKLEIADRLQNGPRDAKTLTRSTKIDAQIFYRLMRGLAWCGLVVHLADDRFSLTPLGECLQTESPDLLTTKMADRCEAIGGDFFTSVPAGGDVYIMKWIIHDWPDDRCIKILKNCYEVMAKDAKLLVVDMVMPEQATPSTPAAMWDLHMMVMLNGIERTETEFRSLFSSAGFNLTQVIPTESGMSIIEGVPV